MGIAIKYEHHGKEVWVNEDLRGKHREHCLCWKCSKFQPSNRDANCPIANAVFSLCVLEDLVLPVWECPEYQFGL